MSGSVAFSFGSFGDITTVLQLAWSLKQILLEAGRGPSEIEELVTHIDVFTSALQQVKGVLEGRNADAPPALANGISLALRTCLQILSDMHNSLEGQKKKITGAVGRSAWLKYLATCSWLLLGGKRKVEGAKKQLSEQVDAITTLLAVANCNGIDSVKTLLQEERITVQSLASSFERLSRRIQVTAAPFYFMDDAGNLVQPMASIPFEVFCKHLLLGPGFAEWRHFCHDTYMTLSMAVTHSVSSPWIDFGNGPVAVGGEPYNLLTVEMDVDFKRRHIRRPRVAVELGCLLYSDPASFGAKRVLLSPAYLTLGGEVLELASGLSGDLSSLLTAPDMKPDTTGVRTQRNLWRVFWKLDILHYFRNEHSPKNLEYYDDCPWDSKSSVREVHMNALDE